MIEEIRSYDDDPDSLVHDALQTHLYPGHPYGRPILGTAATVGKLSRSEIVGFWRAGYAPERALLAVAGPVEEAEVLAAAERLFGDWEGGRARARVTPAPEPREPTATRLRRRFDTATVEIAWRTPPIGHPDLPALDVLAAALGQGTAALLPLRLQLEAGLVAVVWADLNSRIGGGALSVGFIPLEGQTPDAIRLTMETVVGVVRRGLSGRRVARARDALLADLLFSHETVDGVAHDLAWYTARMGGPAAQEDYRRQLSAVTAADVNRVAKTWLRPEHTHLVAVDPTTGIADLRRALAVGRPAPARRYNSGEPVSRVLDNGATIWVLPDQTEVAAIRTVSLGGALAVPDRLAGLGAAWSQMVTCGAGPHDATAYAEACDGLAADVSGTSGRNTLGFFASFPAANLEDSMELVGHALTAPHFAPQEWDRIRAELADELRTLDDRAGQVASRAMWAALYPGHPWRLPQSGTEASIQRITPSAMKRWHCQQLSPDNLVIAVAGGVDPDAVFETVTPWIEALPKGGGIAPRPEPTPRKRHLSPLYAGNEQAGIHLCVRGPDLYHRDRVVLELAAAVLGGQGGRLFLGLREGRGLGYSVWAQWTAGVDGGVFSCGLGTDPDRVDEARDALREELAKMAHEGPTEEELARCREMLVGQMAMSLQRVAGRAADLAVTKCYGLPWGLPAWRGELEKVTPADVIGALQRIGIEDPLEITVLPRA